MPQPRKSQQAYRFKVTIRDIAPTVWRRIEVPEKYTFWDLHVAVQDAFGWSEAHVYEFVFGNPRRGNDRHIGTPMPEDSGENEVMEEWKERIAE